jgi:hypothetical protein
MEAGLKRNGITIYECKGITARVDALGNETHLGLTLGGWLDLATNDLTDVFCHIVFHLLWVLCHYNSTGIR